MATAASLSPAARRMALTDLLTLRGMPRARAQADVARMADAAVIADLEFHMREDAAYKRGQTLPPAELVAHYGGPAHGMDLAATEAFVRLGSQATPAPGPRPDQGTRDFILTGRNIAIGAAALTALGLLIYAVARNPMTDPTTLGGARAT